MSILVIKPGVSGTVQDAGRKGHRSEGVPLSGAMDPMSFARANLLCGNRLDDAGLEVTLHGMELLFEEDILVAMSGGGSIPAIDGTRLPSDRPLWVKAGSLLRFLPSPSGCRMYLAVGGGILAQNDLGSRSTYEPAGLGGIGGRRLQKGDRLQRQQTNALHKRIAGSLKNDEGSHLTGRWGASVAESGSMPSPGTVRCLRGPEWDRSGEGMRDSLFRKDFTVAKDSNRMGIRLTNEGMERLEFPEMVSSGVSPGTIQMAHDGTLLLLMADAQTTGGYPRIAHVAGADIARCAQLRPGDTVRFIETSLLEAELALLQSWRDLRILSHAIREAFERED